MKAGKLITRLKEFLQIPLNIAIDEINVANQTSYTPEDVTIEIKPIVPTDEKEDAEIAQLQAETVQTKVSTVLDIAPLVDEETLLQEICSVMELDYEDVKKKMLQPDEAAAIREVLSLE